MPLLLKGTFSPLGRKGALQPYLTAGAGISLIHFGQYLGEFGGSVNNASFSVQAGGGIKIPFGKYSASGFNLGADYNYINYKQYGFNNLNNLSLRAGVYFPL